MLINKFSSFLRIKQSIYLPIYFLLVLITLHSYASTDDSILNASLAYTKGETSTLNNIYANNSNDLLISYLYAKNMLLKNNPEPSNDLIGSIGDSFIRTDLLHQLLLYYFNNNDYDDYVSNFKLMPYSQLSINEKCGMDYINILTHNSKSNIALSWIMNNDIPAWCAKVVAHQYSHGKISESDFIRMLTNIAISDKYYIFNQITPDLRHDIPNINQYLTVEKIAHISKNNPNYANVLIARNINNNVIKRTLSNYIAMRFASNGQYNNAQKLYNKSNSHELSDPELEWQIRVNLALQQWQQSIYSIEHLPQNLQSQDSWQFYLGYSYLKLHRLNVANKIFNGIPNDYSYYSMLSHSLTQGSINSLFAKAPNGSYSKNADIGAILRIYNLGINNHDRNLINISSAMWRYMAHHNASQDTLLSMNYSALEYGIYNLSVNAANGLKVRSINLSYPYPFLDLFKKYAKLVHISPTYLLAISHQESLFNRFAIAFDGGVGLMQIMPTTASYIANKMHSKDCYSTSYECNIKFGAWYLKNLLDSFNGNIIYATAAYNGGPHNASNWQNATQMCDNVIKIELIPFDITRNYVQRVLTNKMIYDSTVLHSNNMNLYRYIISK